MCLHWKKLKGFFLTTTMEKLQKQNSEKVLKRLFLKWILKQPKKH